MGKRYIGVYAKSKEESYEYQKVLFSIGFEWCNGNGLELTKHTNFYARFEDMKIITCYHDPSIDCESLKLSIDELRAWNKTNEN